MAKVGDTNTPVFVDANGEAQPCTVPFKPISVEDLGDADGPIIAYVEIDGVRVPIHDKNTGYVPTTEHTIKFKNTDGTILEEKQAVYGTLPVYNGAIPESELQPEVVLPGKNYRFDKWTPDIEVVTKNAEYSATYIATPKTFKVTFRQSKDGIFTTLAVREAVEYGTAAVAPDLPSVEGYTTSTWDKDFSNIMEDTVVTCVLSLKVYEVTFDPNGGSFGGVTDPVSNTATHGTLFKNVRPADPAKVTETGAYYPFLGWGVDDNTPITGPVTYTAQWSEDLVINTFESHDSADSGTYKLDKGVYRIILVGAGAHGVGDAWASTVEGIGNRFAAAAGGTGGELSATLRLNTATEFEITVGKMGVGESSPKTEAEATTLKVGSVLVGSAPGGKIGSASALSLSATGGVGGSADDVVANIDYLEDIIKLSGNQGEKDTYQATRSGDHGAYIGSRFGTFSDDLDKAGTRTESTTKYYGSGGGAQGGIGGGGNIHCNGNDGYIRIRKIGDVTATFVDGYDNAVLKTDKVDNPGEEVTPPIDLPLHDDATAVCWNACNRVINDCTIMPEYKFTVMACINTSGYGKITATKNDGTTTATITGTSATKVDDYQRSSGVVLTATPTAATSAYTYVFLYWDDDHENTNPVRMVPIGSRTYKAVFARYGIVTSVTVTPRKAGTTTAVSTSYAKATITGVPCVPGSSYTLTANDHLSENDGGIYQFQYWDDLDDTDPRKTQREITFDVPSDNADTARTRQHYMYCTLQRMFSFVLNGGAFAEGVVPETDKSGRPRLLFNDGTPSVKPQDPTKDGATFAGWFTNSACTTEFTAWGDNVSAAKVLYAKWE